MWMFFIILTLGVNSIASQGSPPMLRVQPPNGEVLFRVSTTESNGRPLTLDCLADGNPEPEYSWTKNGVALEDEVLNFTGNGTIVIKNPQSDNEGNYQCMAQNKYGIAMSNVVSVRRAVLESFKNDEPTTITVDEGAPFKLECNSPHGYPKPKVFWLLTQTDGGLKSLNLQRITNDPEGTLWFSNVTKADESDNFFYTCSAINVFLNEYKHGNRVKLVVKSNKNTDSVTEPIRQFLSKKNEVALSGKRAELFCIFGGTPQPKIIWTRDGRPIQWNDHISLGNFGKSILIKKTTIDDVATYKCEASSLGKKQTHSISLKVNELPHFTVEPANVNGAEGGSVEIKCEASGIPEPELQWIFNGKPLNESEPNENRLVELHKITLHNLNKNDIGNYGCNASNSLGYVYKESTLTMLETPES